MKTFTSLVFRISGHRWKEAVRSSYWQKSIMINLLLGIFLLYFLVNLVILGVFLGRILTASFPDTEPVKALSEILLYYFMGDFLLRFFMQPVPVISVMPYLHLPVKRSSIFHFLLLRSGLSLFNLFPVIILVPFTIRYVIPAYSAGAGLAWLCAIILLVFANNYLSFFFKKLFAVKPGVILPLAAFLALLAYTDFSQTRIVSQTFGEALMQIILHPSWIVFPAALLLFCYGLSWRMLYRQRYLEAKVKHERVYYSTEKSRYFFEIFGLTGKLASLEMKLILRNNRPRTYLIISLIFLLYGFMIYSKHQGHLGYGTMLFAGLLLTGIITMQYGQLVLSWESSYFDRLCTAGFSTLEFFTAKFWLFFLFNTATFMVSLPYALFDSRILLLNLAAWFFNCGINIFIILYLGTYNTKRIDMSKGAFFNYEGVTAAQFILILPIIGFPVLIYGLFALAGLPEAGVLAIGLSGLAGLAFHRQLIEIVTRKFLARKQKILTGFRNG